jgi:hypothetical protein
MRNWCARKWTLFPDFSLFFKEFSLLRLKNALTELPLVARKSCRTGALCDFWRRKNGLNHVISLLFSRIAGNVDVRVIALIRRV